MKMVACLLFFITLVIYACSSRGEGAYYNYFVFLSDAFLHGRLDILNFPPWLNEMVFWKGNYYTVFPPMPAILLVPFVAIFGIAFHQPILSWLLGAASVALSYLVFTKLFDKKIVLWTSILYGFGTIQWYHAEVGSAWYLAHITALFFLWLLLLEVFSKKRFPILGILLGGAYLSRLPTVFSVIFIILYLHKDLFIFQNRALKIIWRNWIFLILGFLPFMLLNFALNYFRYGVFYDIGYSLLPIFDEPWYKYGLISIRYISVHLREMFTAMPLFSINPPFVIPSLFALAVWFTTPAFILIIFAKIRTKLVLISLTTLIAVALPSLMHGGNGFTQFGYRHTLDYMPFLLILTASGMRDKVTLWVKILIISSILVNLWGVVMISWRS